MPTILARAVTGIVLLAAVATGCSGAGSSAPESVPGRIPESAPGSALDPTPAASASAPPAAGAVGSEECRLGATS